MCCTPDRGMLFESSVADEKCLPWLPWSFANIANLTGLPVAGGCHAQCRVADRCNAVTLSVFVCAPWDKLKSIQFNKQKNDHQIRQTHNRQTSRRRERRYENSSLFLSHGWCFLSRFSANLDRNTICTIEIVIELCTKDSYSPFESRLLHNLDRNSEYSSFIQRSITLSVRFARQKREFHQGLLFSFTCTSDLQRKVVARCVRCVTRALIHSR